MSFYISLSGLKAAQTDLSTIANNVANANTTAFKRSQANFGDIFAAAPMQTTQQVSGQGVRVQGINQQFTQGTTQGTDNTLDLAITGEGFFTVKRGADDQVSYTRNGAFSVTNDRYVVDTTGSRLQVVQVDPLTGAPTTPSSSSSSSASGGASAVISSNGSLTTTSANGTKTAVKAAGTSNDVEITAPDGTITLAASDGTITVTPPGGTPVVTTPTPGTNQTTSIDGTVTVKTASGITWSKALDGTVTVKMPNGTTTTAAADGTTTIQASNGKTTVTAPDGTVTTAGNGNWTGSLTGLADLQIPTNWPDGGTGNQLSSVGVSEAGSITGVYADGTTVHLGLVAMAAFNSQDGLRQQGDSHWTATAASGEPMIGTAASGLYGSINAGTLERSNVDITEELVALISAQRNFQANSKAIEAANTLSTTIVNMRT